MPLTAHIPGEFDIEKVRGETLNAERCPIAGRMGVDVAAQPALEVEIGRDRTVVEELLLAVLERTVALQRAFRFDPQLIVIGADPAFPSATASPTTRRYSARDRHGKIS